MLIESSHLDPCHDVGGVTNDNENKTTFKDLGVCDELVRACDVLGWKRPTKIQAEAIPYALQGNDIIGIAQTGTGKTGAFVIPIVQALLETCSPSPFFACVISPTRELAIQIADQFNALGAAAAMNMRTVVLVGGLSHTQQSIALARRPHILVATPGRLLFHLVETKGFSLSMMKYLVLDEADRLLGDEFEKEMDKFFEVMPRQRSTFLFSATMTKKWQKIQRASVRKPVKIEAAVKYSVVDNLKQECLIIPAIQRNVYLVHILTLMSGSTSIVFTNTCSNTRLLALMLRNLGFKSISISGEMSQDKRFGALRLFKTGDCNILVCTDVASRGLDIPSVDLVIIYDIPSNPKDYVHRVGRTARAGRSGLALSLVHQYDAMWFTQIEAHIKKKVPVFSAAPEEEVLLLAERVYEAKRMSDKTIGGTKARKKRGMPDSEEDGVLGKILLGKHLSSRKKWRK